MDSLLEGVDRLRLARVARAELAALSVEDLREALALRRAGLGGGRS